MYDVKPFTHELGVVLDARGPMAVADVPIPEVMALLRRHGVVYFRGFGTPISEFEAYAKLFEARAGRSLPEQLQEGYVNAAKQAEVQAWVQVTREAPPLVLRGVNPSQEALYPHSENAYLPAPTDLLWFYCEHPARERGRTTLVDGIRMLAEMDDDLLNFFRRQNITYNTVYDRAFWQSVFGLQEVAQVRAVLDSLPGVSHRLQEEESLAVRFSVPAIKKTKYGQQDAFVNQVLNGHYTPQFGLCMEDDSRIPEEIMKRLLSLVDRIVVPVPWKAQEFALVDNSRLLHGREDFRGEPARTIKVLEIQHGLA